MLIKDTQQIHFDNANNSCMLYFALGTHDLQGPSNGLAGDISDVELTCDACLWIVRIMGVGSLNVLQNTPM